MISFPQIYFEMKCKFCKNNVDIRTKYLQSMFERNRETREESKFITSANGRSAICLRCKTTFSIPEELIEGLESGKYKEGQMVSLKTDKPKEAPEEYYAHLTKLT